MAQSCNIPHHLTERPKILNLNLNSTYDKILYSGSNAIWPDNHYAIMKVNNEGYANTWTSKLEIKLQNVTYFYKQRMGK
jgi:hypothetical protein